MRWSEEEIKFLIENYDFSTNKELALELNRSLQLICKFIFDIITKEDTRKIIKPYELDVYYPKYNLAIEENSKNFESDIKSQIINNLGKINDILGVKLSNEDIEEIEINQLT